MLQEPEQELEQAQERAQERVPEPAPEPEAVRAQAPVPVLARAPERAPVRGRVCAWHPRAPLPESTALAKLTDVMAFPFLFNFERFTSSFR